MRGGLERPGGILAIAGPTASGKTELAIRVAEELDGEVISADAFAVYRGLDAGTAKPRAEELSRVPHHLIDIKDPADFYSAGEFAETARRIANDILARGRLPILCGGTGFYVRAFFDGLFVGPKRDTALRGALKVIEEKRGAPHLHRMLRLLDPVAGDAVSENDWARSMRYLEIAFTTGRRPSRLFVEAPGERWERPSVKVYLALPRPTLYERIECRFKGSMVSALPNEVRGLLARGVSPAAPSFAAIGYRETVELLAGRLSESEWEEEVLRATRHFAKRQETWFRKEVGLITLRADAPDLLERTCRHALALFS
ncbi:MAG: tRNA dimethylallyltransferase [Thermoanaerobaculia bacterium]|nr:tRNA dimethylallyltransferase [Thermoanaerobaculia bacterium]